MIPKPFRHEKLPPDVAALRKPKPKGWNPATFFIVIFLLIGSMSIQMISLKKDFATFVRQSDVRIGLLREAVEKIQKGEKVDVERLLGTGDPEKEEEWEEVLNEIARGDASRNRKKEEKKATEAVSSRESASTSAQAESKSTTSFF